MSFIKKSENYELKNDILFSIYLRQAIYLMQKKNTKKHWNTSIKQKIDDTGLADCCDK